MYDEHVYDGHRGGELLNFIGYFLLFLTDIILFIFHVFKIKIIQLDSISHRQ